VGMTHADLWEAADEEREERDAADALYAQTGKQSDATDWYKAEMRLARARFRARISERVGDASKTVRLFK